MKRGGRGWNRGCEERVAVETEIAQARSRNISRRSSCHGLKRWMDGCMMVMDGIFFVRVESTARICIENCLFPFHVCAMTDSHVSVGGVDVDGYKLYVGP